MMLRFREMMVATKASIRALAGDRKGVTAMEYGVIAAAMVVAISAIVGTMGTRLGVIFTSISAALN